MQYLHVLLTTFGIFFVIYMLAIYMYDDIINLVKRKKSL